MQPGEPVRVEMTKWGGRPHWEYDGVLLGTDEHGEWLGFPAGTRYARPGLAFDAEFRSVVLVPAGEAWHLAAFNDDQAHHRVYVDMTTPPRWDPAPPPATLRAVDLDLDVVRLQDGTVYVDDEDEFAEHQRAYGYPPDVVAGAEQSAAAVLAAVRDLRAPYDEQTPQRWLALLA